LYYLLFIILASVISAITLIYRPGFTQLHILNTSFGIDYTFIIETEYISLSHLIEYHYTSFSEPYAHVSFGDWEIEIIFIDDISFEIESISVYRALRFLIFLQMPFLLLDSSLFSRLSSFPLSSSSLLESSSYLLHDTLHTAFSSGHFLFIGLFIFLILFRRLIIIAAITALHIIMSHTTLTRYLYWDTEFIVFSLVFSRPLINISKYFIFTVSLNINTSDTVRLLLSLAYLHTYFLLVIIYFLETNSHLYQNISIYLSFRSAQNTFTLFHYYWAPFHISRHWWYFIFEILAGFSLEYDIDWILIIFSSLLFFFFIFRHFLFSSLSRHLLMSLAL